jgi:hypothetical protein
MKPKKARTSVIRKIINNYGHNYSRAIVLPKSWLDHVEAKAGRKATHVKLTINEILTLEVLTIEPLFNVDPSVLKKHFSLMPKGQGDKP